MRNRHIFFFFLSLVVNNELPLFQQKSCLQQPHYRHPATSPILLTPTLTFSLLGTAQGASPVQPLNRREDTAKSTLPEATVCCDHRIQQRCSQKKQRFSKKRESYKNKKTQKLIIKEQEQITQITPIKTSCIQQRGKFPTTHFSGH